MSPTDRGHCRRTFIAKDYLTFNPFWAKMVPAELKQSLSLTITQQLVTIDTKLSSFSVNFLLACSSVASSKTLQDNIQNTVELYMHTSYTNSHTHIRQSKFVRGPLL